MKIALIAFIVPLCLATSTTAQQRPIPPPPTITVNGEATVDAEPDQAQIDIGVTTRRTTRKRPRTTPSVAPACSPR